MEGQEEQQQPGSEQLGQTSPAPAQVETDPGTAVEQAAEALAEVKAAEVSSLAQVLTQVNETLLTLKAVSSQLQETLAEADRMKLEIAETLAEIQASKEAHQPAQPQQPAQHQEKRGGLKTLLPLTSK